MLSMRLQPSRPRLTRSALGGSTHRVRARLTTMNYIVNWIAGCRDSLVQATGDRPAKHRAARAAFPTIAASLATVRRDARFVAVEGRAADLGRLAEFRRLRGLWVEDASTKTSR